MGRNGTGVAAISESSIEITFAYRGARCRERIKLEPTPANLKRAERHRAAILDAIEKGTFDYATTFPDSPRRFKFAELKGEVQTVADYLEAWLQRQKKHLKASTWDDYRKIIDHFWIPRIGKHTLSDLKRPHIRDELDEVDDVSNKRLANMQSPLRKALQDAVDDEIIENNPMYGWKYSRQEAPKVVDDVDPFSAEEQQAILSACAEPQYLNLFQFALWTGLRTSELVALEWGDIDWLRGNMRISRALTQDADEPELPKTKRGARDVKLLGPALEALQRQKSHTFLAGGVVFHDPRTNERWAGDQPIRQNAWAKVIKKSGVRYRRPYQTRHTYASMMLSAGESPMWVAAQMGHSDWTMIARVYGRWIPDADRHDGEKAVALFALATAKEKSA